MSKFRGINGRAKDANRTKPSQYILGRRRIKLQIVPFFIDVSHNLYRHTSSSIRMVTLCIANFERLQHAISSSLKRNAGFLVPNPMSMLEPEAPCQGFHDERWREGFWSLLEAKASMLRRHGMWEWEWERAKVGGDNGEWTFDWQALYTGFTLTDQILSRIWPLVSDRSYAGSAWDQAGRRCSFDAWTHGGTIVKQHRPSPYATTIAVDELQKRVTRSCCLLEEGLKKNTD